MSISIRTKNIAKQNALSIAIIGSKFFSLSPTYKHAHADQPTIIGVVNKSMHITWADLYFIFLAYDKIWWRQINVEITKITAVTPIAELSPKLSWFTI
ncbi:unnamed protein product [Blepharisma stoltei]|uniref:Uncharacterized protein n=1 Tax=Blepharisma stoltei TaxID=1481888 RepID=A0AAU9J9S7_9CILI|nr:unnamed protein product [Blepharisma stoltei]